MRQLKLSHGLAMLALGAALFATEPRENDVQLVQTPASYHAAILG